MEMDTKLAFEAVVLPTKSMQQIVTSIATKVTHLIISSSEKQSSSSPNAAVGDSVYAKLVSSSESIVKALKNLVKVSKQTVANNYANDETIVEEVDVAAQNLIVAGENLNLCCQILVSTNGEKLPTDTTYNLDLTSCISKCFQNLVVMLLCIDNAEVRLLITLSNVLLDHLYVLCGSDTMESLVENFSAFGSAVQTFHARASLRCEDLLSTTNQNKMTKALTTLAHSMPMLTTAYSLAMKYPRNDEAASAKSFATQQIEKTVATIIAVIKARTEACDWSKEGEIGIFASHIRSVESAISPENRTCLVTLELETMVQCLIQHLMSLASFVSQRVAKFAKKSNHLVKEGQKLLELVSVVVRLSSNFRSPNSSNIEISLSSKEVSEYGSVCRAIRGKLKNIESRINTLLASLFCHVFTVTSEPLTSLTKAFVQDPKLHVAPTLGNALKAFQVHCEDIVQVANILSICCADPHIYRDFQPSVDKFSSSTKQIVIISQKVNLGGKNRKQEFPPNLAENWLEALNGLTRCCVLSLDLTQLTTEVENGVSSDFEKCHEEIVNLDDVTLSKHVITATGKAKLLITIANDVISANASPLYRNGVLAHVKQLQEATAHVIASSNLLIEDMARLASQEAFLASASHLKSKAARVCAALLSKANHPPVTSEERKGLRELDDSSKIEGMIKEMRNLNNKLAQFGFEPKLTGFQKSTKNHANRKPYSAIVDELFATSGPVVDIETAAKTEVKNALSFGNGAHPLTIRLLEVCQPEKKDQNALRSAAEQIQRMTRYILAACEDSEPSINTSKYRVKDITDGPAYVCTQDVDVETHSILDVVIYWRKSLSESCNLLQGAILEENFCLVTVQSLCVSWSKAFRILLGCLIAALKIFLISFRRFISIPESLSSSNDTEMLNSSRNKFRKDEGLVTAARAGETLFVLLSDVLVLHKREVNSHNEEKKVSLITRIEVLLARAKQVISEIHDGEKSLKEISKEETISDYDISWVHAFSVLCASKLCALFSLVDTTVQLVLGIRKPELSADIFTVGSFDHSSLNDYKSTICSLSLSATGKIEASLNNQNMDTQAALKLNKMKNRIDVTRGSIEDVIGFVTRHEDFENLLSKHGHLVFHLFFLHQRFSLDVARTFLVTKAISLISESHRDQLPDDIAREVAIHFASETQEAKTTVGEVATPPNSPTYAERLKSLTKQRKEREKELFLLLSDIDAQNADIRDYGNSSSDDDL